MKHAVLCVYLPEAQKYTIDPISSITYLNNVTQSKITKDPQILLRKAQKCQASYNHLLSHKLKTNSLDLQNPFDGTCETPTQLPINAAKRKEFL